MAPCREHTLVARNGGCGHPHVHSVPQPQCLSLSASASAPQPQRLSLSASAWASTSTNQGQTAQPKSVTSPTHSESQLVLQQYESCAQTHEAIPATVQPAPPLTWQQLPTPPPPPPPVHEPQPLVSTAPAHSESQELSQQNGSCAQIQEVIDGLEHPGVSLGSQQSLAPPQVPQSTGQLLQSSLASQVALPQTGPPPPQVPQPSSSTSFTHS